MSAPVRSAERSEGKVQPWHRDRLAAVYVRQSTAAQVLDHQESTRLQYGLAERAVALGWAPARVLVIDEDLGHSASGADARPGFQRLVSEVGLDHVGIVLGVEMSRLARSSAGRGTSCWSCARITGTLLVDPDGVYDPGRHERPRSCWAYPPPPDRRLQRRATFRRASGNGRWRLVIFPS